MPPRCPTKILVTRACRWGSLGILGTVVIYSQR
jgi:hypothetical protein